MVHDFVMNSVKRLFAAAEGIGALTDYPGVEEAAMQSAILYGTPQPDAHGVAKLAYGVIDRDLVEDTLMAISTARVGVTCQRQRADDAIDRMEDMVYGDKLLVHDKRSLLIKNVIKGVDSNFAPIANNFEIEESPSSEGEEESECRKWVKEKLGEILAGEVDESTLERVFKYAAPVAQQWTDKLCGSRTTTCSRQPRTNRSRQSICTLRSLFARDAFRSSRQIFLARDVSTVETALRDLVQEYALSWTQRIFDAVMFFANLEDNNSEIELGKLGAAAACKVIKLKKKGKKKMLLALAFLVHTCPVYALVIAYPLDRGIETALRMLGYCKHFDSAWKLCLSTLQARKRILDYHARQPERVKLDRLDAASALAGPLDIALACARDAMNSLEKEFMELYNRICLHADLLAVRAQD